MKRNTAVQYKEIDSMIISYNIAPYHKFYQIDVRFENVSKLTLYELGGGRL